MSRGRVVVIEEEMVALIERVRDGRTYYVFPGGGAEGDETPEDAAVREAWEELGVRVRLRYLLTTVCGGGEEQRFYVATIESGAFGSGTALEFDGPPDGPKGAYRPIWIALSCLSAYDVRPVEVAAMLASPSFRPDEVANRDG